MIQFKRGTTKELSAKQLDNIIAAATKEVLKDANYEFKLTDLLFPTLSLVTNAAELAKDINAKIVEKMSEQGDGTWQKIILANGQPGYDRRTYRLKIGDGVHTWQQLPNVGGLEYDQVLDSEEKAKIRQAINPIDKTVFTYGEEEPNRFTVGQVYLHQYGGDIETDYVIETGVDGDWTYRKWHSGLAECWCTTDYENVAIKNEIGSLFCSPILGALDYPQKISFIDAPTEIINATVLTIKEVLEDSTTTTPEETPDDNTSGDGSTEGNTEPVSAPVDPIIFVTTGKTVEPATGSEVTENTGEVLNTKEKSSRVYLTSPVSLVADVRLNLMVKGRFERS